MVTCPQISVMEFAPSHSHACDPLINRRMPDREGLKIYPRSLNCITTAKVLAAGAAVAAIESQNQETRSQGLRTGNSPSFTAAATSSCSCPANFTLNHPSLKVTRASNSLPLRSRRAISFRCIRNCVGLIFVRLHI